MASSVRIEINSARILAKIDRRWMAKLPYIASEIRKNTNEYVKYDHGMLRDSSYTNSELSRGLIVWRTAYAQRQYRTGKPRRVKNANASILWCEVSKRKHMAQWARMATRQLSGRL